MAAPSLPSSAPEQSSPVAPGPEPRAKALRPFARKPALEREDFEGFVRAQLTAKAFGLVLREMRIANTTVASMWGVTESVVRRVIEGDKPLTYAKVQQLPEDLRAALDRKTLELLTDLRALGASLPTVPEALRSAAPAAANDHFVARPR